MDDLTEAKLRARHHAQSATKLRGGRPAPEPDPTADGRMCRLLLMEMCRLNGEACEAWVFCHEEGCTDGPSFGADTVQGDSRPPQSVAGAVELVDSQ